MKYLAMPTSSAKAIWNGDVDANGQVPEQMRSDGNNNPCRHCLHEIAEGDTMLVFSYRPFDSVQPYAETGPIFMHKTQCEKYDASAGLPTLYRNRDMIIRGYTSADRIVYGTGKVISMESIHEEVGALFTKTEVDYVHVRSASNNCYHFRIDHEPR